MINHTNIIYFLTSIQSISLKLKNYSLMFGWIYLWSSEDFVVLCTYNIKHRFTINITFYNHNKTRRTIRTWRERHKKSVVVFFNSFLNFTKSKMRRKWVDWKHESHKKGKLYEQWVSLEVNARISFLHLISLILVFVWCWCCSFLKTYLNTNTTELLCW